VAKYSPRLTSLFTAVLAGSILAPILTFQGYMFRIFPRLGVSPPSPATDAFSLAACCLAFALYPMVGLVYSLMERHRHGPVLSKVLAAILSAYLVLAVQVTLGQLTAAYLGVDPSADSRAALDATRGIYGVMLYPLMLLGVLMLLGLLAAMASVPVIIFEYTVVRKREPLPS